MLDRALRPGRIGPLELPHRLLMGSMHLGFETRGEEGAMGAFYSERARGGAGLMITGGCAVNPEGVAGATYGLSCDERYGARLGVAVRAVHEEGGLMALQLFHAGRYADMTPGGLPPGVRPVAPSAIPSRFSREAPLAMDEGMIRETIADFARAGAWARELGFDGVEIMASEGYLINQFCSPLTNRRQDRWGGDGIRRQALALEVLGAVREAAGPELAVIVRMSGADLMEGSSSQEEVLALARALAAGGADALNVGIGWHEARVPTVQGLVPAGSFDWVAARIRAALSAGGPGSHVRAVPVIAGNRVNRLEQAEGMLAEGVCDFVSMARPFLADPEIVARARRGRGDLVNLCVSCDQACIDRSLVDEGVSCMVNPRAGRELEDPVAAPAISPMPGARVAVIGGGPAGLAAAEALGLLGAEVHLFERSSRLGGQFRLAERIPGKGDFGAAADSFAARLAELGIQVHLEAELTPRDAAETLSEFAGAVLATGVQPRGIDLEGSDLPHVRGYIDGIEHPEELGERVVIIGAGGIGVDLAHLLSDVRGESVDPAAFLAAHGLPPGASGPAAGASGPAAGASGPATASKTTGITPRTGPRIPSRRVTLVCRSARAGHGIGRTSRWAVIDSLRRARVEIVTGARYGRILPQGLELLADAERAGAGLRLLEADTIVLATGQLAHDPLGETLATLGIPHRVVGGARASAGLDAVRAFAEGRRAAAELIAACGAGGVRGSGGAAGSASGISSRS